MILESNKIEIVQCIALQTYKIKPKNAFKDKTLGLTESKNYESQHTPSHLSDRLDATSMDTDYSHKTSFSKVTARRIDQVLAHVLQRPYLAVSPEAPFFQVGTYLATGSKIYVDGLIVARDKRLVGRISGKNILRHVLNMRGDDWSSATALELMDGNASSVEFDSSLSSVLELFARTKFALAPITDKESLIGSIVIRDLLQLVSELNVDSPVTMICSPIARICNTETLKSSIEILLKNNIRNLVISPAEADDANCEQNYILSDRMILEYIFSYEGRKIMKHGPAAKALSSVSVNCLDMIPVSFISENQSISKAAAMLNDISTPGLYLKNYIITPWDVVMKTIGKEYLT